MADRRIQNYQRKLKDEAAASLDQLRQQLEISPMKTPNRRQITSDSQSSPYSASVERLKDLIKRHNKGSSKRKSSQNDSSLNLNGPPLDELAPLLDDQNSLLEHLEGQVSYYKDALSTLKQKAEVVIEENSRLHQQIVSGIQEEIGELGDNQSMEEISLKSLMIDCAIQTEKYSKAESNHEPSTGLMMVSNEFKNFEPKTDDAADVDKVEEKAEYFKESDDELKKLQDVHAIKTKQLEAMLKSAREQIEENRKYIKTLEAGKSTSDGTDASNIFYKPESSGLCIKCAHNKAVLTGFHPAANEKVLRRMERENNDLLETVNKQREMLETARKKEVDAFIQVKKSCELAEDVQLQKHEANIKYQQAMKEIERLKEENRKHVAKTNDLIQTERHRIQSEHEENIAKEAKKFDELAEKLSRTEVQLDRVTREKLDLKDSMMKLEECTESHDKEMMKKLDGIRLSLAEAMKECSIAKEQNQRLDKEKKNLEMMLEKKNTFSNDEMKLLRKRLTESTNKLDTVNHEHIQLSEKLHLCEKQLQSERMSRTQEMTLHENQLEKLKMTYKRQEEKLLESMRQTEEKYESTKNELGSMLESQIAIANNFKAEFKRSMERQEEIENKYRHSHTKMHDENSSLKNDVLSLRSENNALSAQVSELRNELKVIEKSLADAEIQAKTYSEKAVNLLSKYKITLKERQHLCEEVEFLKSQLPGFRHGDKISLSDLESTDQLV